MNKFGPLVSDAEASRAVSAELLREIQEGKLNITQYARNREWWLGPQPDVFTSVLVPVLLAGVSRVWQGLFRFGSKNSAAAVPSRAR
jgi:hypothetical protein